MNDQYFNKTDFYMNPKSTQSPGPVPTEPGPSASTKPSYKDIRIPEICLAIIFLDKNLIKQEIELLGEIYQVTKSTPEELEIINGILKAQRSNHETDQEYREKMVRDALETVVNYNQYYRSTKSLDYVRLIIQALNILSHVEKV